MWQNCLIAIILIVKFLLRSEMRHRLPEWILLSVTMKWKTRGKNILPIMDTQLPQNFCWSNKEITFFIFYKYLGIVETKYLSRYTYFVYFASFTFKFDYQFSFDRLRKLRIVGVNIHEIKNWILRLIYFFIFSKTNRCLMGIERK